jgi:hypothetical protein
MARRDQIFVGVETHNSVNDLPEARRRVLMLALQFDVPGTWRAGTRNWRSCSRIWKNTWAVPVECLAVSRALVGGPREDIYRTGLQIVF